MKPESSQPSSESGQTGGADVPVGDSLPVFLDDEALQSMEGETVPAGEMGADSDEGARLAVSKSPASSSRRSDFATATSGRAGGGRRFSYFKALIIFLIVQLLVMVIVAAVFRRPLTQAYDKLVERGFIEPNSLPWQTGAVGGAADSSVGDVAWEDVRQRHQMTLLADAAIARADRGAFDELRGLLDIDSDPARRAAARAEVFRVQQMYTSASKSATPPLPVAEIFPGVSEESELSEEQLVKLLSDPDREAERRVRAAELLDGHRTLMATDALVRAMQKDKNLDVIKRAMASFKSNTGYPGNDMFDASAAEKWWSENASRLAGEFERFKSDKAAAESRAVEPQRIEPQAQSQPRVQPRPQSTKPVPEPVPQAGRAPGGAGGDGDDTPQTRAIRPIER